MNCSDPNNGYLDVQCGCQLCTDKKARLPVQTASLETCGCELKCSGLEFELSAGLSKSEGASPRAICQSTVGSI